MKPNHHIRPAILAGLHAVCLVTLTSCATTKTASPEPATKPPVPPPTETIKWPDEYRPEKATFYVHNEIEIAAPPRVVWDLLIEAQEWPDWYQGALDVQIQQPPGTRLQSRAVFTWKTMGFDFESRVREFVPPYRLSWESRRSSIRGYHAWLIIPTGTGCRVITDESQFGLLAAWQRVFLPNKLARLHDVWLAELEKKAEAKSGRSAAR